MLTRLTPSGREALIAHGVRTIVDVRTSEELARDVGYPFRDTQRDGEPAYVNVSFVVDLTPEQEAEVRRQRESATQLGVLNRMDIDVHRAGIGAVISAVADAQPGGVLIHCYAGKDRTGMTVALLLALAGVSDADIADDYALTMLNLEPLIMDWLNTIEDPAERQRMHELATPRQEAIARDARVRARELRQRRGVPGAGGRQRGPDRAHSDPTHRARRRLTLMDDIAREYLLIGLSLGELQEGVVDAYFGPPQVKQQALTDKASPTDLAARSMALRARLNEVTDAQRARWLDRQLIATETLARQINGEQFEYRELVERCFDATARADAARAVRAGAHGARRAAARHRRPAPAPRGARSDADRARRPARHDRRVAHRAAA